MDNIFYEFTEEDDEYLKLKENVIRYLDNLGKLSKILIVPPDYTRKHSQAGIITKIIYEELKDTVKIDILPATGTHKPITGEEIKDMFGESIPSNLFIDHDWQNDTVKIGEIPENFLGKISDGYLNEDLDVEINKLILNKDYDKIISIGQVLPHGVVGMANYTKNIVVGCGGKDIINKSHYLGAIYGLERLIGKDHSPVRKLYDYIEENMLKELPIDYILTVNKASISEETGLSGLSGIFIGNNREVFNRAVSLSQKVNITYINKSVDKFVVYLNPKEFVSMWLCNKAIYRTRSAIADNGEIIIVASGLRTIGENDKFDYLIKKYGYVGTDQVVSLVKKNKELRDNLAVPAHLIHGSPEDRFEVTYVSDNISKELINKVGYNYLSLDELNEIYNIAELETGWNNLGDEDIYYIEDPATGLWVTEDHI